MSLLLLSRVATLPAGHSVTYEDLRNAVAHLPDSLVRTSPHSSELWCDFNAVKLGFIIIRFEFFIGFREANAQYVLEINQC